MKNYGKGSKGKKESHEQNRRTDGEISKGQEENGQIPQGKQTRSGEGLDQPQGTRPHTQEVHQDDRLGCRGGGQTQREESSRETGDSPEEKDRDLRSNLLRLPGCRWKADVARYEEEIQGQDEEPGQGQHGPKGGNEESNRQPQGRYLGQKFREEIRKIGYPGFEDCGGW